MKIIALEFYENGFMKESLAFGGSVEKENIDPNKTIFINSHTRSFNIFKRKESYETLKIDI